MAKPIPIHIMRERREIAQCFHEGAYVGVRSVGAAEEPRTSLLELQRYWQHQVSGLRADLDVVTTAPAFSLIAKLSGFYRTAAQELAEVSGLVNKYAHGVAN